MRLLKVVAIVGAFAVVLVGAPASGAVGARTVSPKVTAPGVDWAQFRGGPRHPGANPFETVLDPSNVSGLTVKWRFRFLPDAVSSPVVAGGVVYFGTQSDHGVYALSESTGALIWKATTGAFVDSTPAVANGLVFVGSGDGKLYAFRTSDGSLVWSAATGDVILSSPTVVDGVVYVGSDDGSVYAYHAATGSLAWRAALGGQVEASPAVAYGTVFVGSRNGVFYALDAATGAQRWTYAAEGGVTGSAAIRQGVVYAGSLGGTLFALDATSGAVVWTRRVAGGIASSPAVANGVVYFTSVGPTRVETIQARSRTSGRLLWSRSYGNLLGGSFIEPSPSVANGVVYAGFLDGTIRAFDASSGSVLWHYSDSAFFASAAIVAGQVFTIGGATATVYDFSLPG